MSEGNAAGLESGTSSPPAVDKHWWREALRLFWLAADGYVKSRLLLATALVTIISVLMALTPLVLKLILDTFAAAAKGTENLAPITLLTLYVIGQYLVRSFTELRTLVHGQAGQRVRRRMGERLVEHIASLPLRFHLDSRAGAVGETADQGLRGYDLVVEQLLYTVLPVLTELVVVCVVLVHLGLEQYISMLGLAGLAYALVFYRGVRAFRESTKDIAAAHADVHAVMTDVLVNAEAVKYFDSQETLSRRFAAVMGRIESVWGRFYRERVANRLLIAAIFGLFIAAALLHAGSEVLHGGMTMGAFVMINVYVVRLTTPLETLGIAVREIAQGIAFLQKMLAFLREPAESDEVGDGTAADVGGGELRFDDVSFSYRRDFPVLRNVSFRIPAGHTVAIVGASGSGKSSLIRLLFRLYEPDGGRILLDGQPIAQIPLRALRRAIAVVPQDTVLFHDTVFNNIAFARSEATREEIEQAARVAHLHELIEGLPDRYNTVVGERGLKLSGGEKQRVAIARAVLKRPRIFVFDEATSSLDSTTEREILSNFLKISHRSTTVVVAHRLSTIQHAEKIIVLDKGRIVERGTHSELRRRHGHYEALWMAQHAAAVSGDVQAKVAKS